MARKHVNTEDVRRAHCARTIWFDDARQALPFSRPFSFPFFALRQAEQRQDSLRESGFTRGSREYFIRRFRAAGVPLLLVRDKRASGYRLCEILSHPRLRSLN